mmetsp:Transcript_30348/g.33901  ORF Transcript_30348/g.33901 Transcript_30348/m.33901 type:complete len:300 (-) Transcript_30348:258-1157(-)
MIASPAFISQPKEEKVSVSSPSPKRVPKKKSTPKKRTPKKPQEKRLARYRSKASSKIMDRIYRARSQRIYLISRAPPKQGSLTHQFVVLGSVGNVYTVEIGHIPSCTCPDHANGYICKHIIMVYLKVLKVPSSSSYIYQHALLTSELEDIYAKAPADPRSAFASQAVRTRYAEITGSKSPDLKKGNDGVKQKPVEGACPICYEDFEKRDKVVFCKAACGNNVHTNCFNMWEQQKLRAHEKVTCVLCRAPWISTGSGKKKKANVNEHKEGYMNLGGYQDDQSRFRDTSSYRYNSYYRGYY